MPRLIWVFAGRTFILLVLSCRGSYYPFRSVNIFRRCCRLFHSRHRLFVVFLEPLIFYIRSVFVICLGTHHCLDLQNNMSLHTTKPTQWPVRPAKMQNSLGICPVWSESSKLCALWVAKESRFLRLWSDWADAQADLSLGWVHSSFCCFCHEKRGIFVILEMRIHSHQGGAIIKPHHEKTCLQSLRPGQTQTDLLSKQEP